MVKEQLRWTVEENQVAKGGGQVRKPIEKGGKRVVFVELISYLRKCFRKI